MPRQIGAGGRDGQGKDDQCDDVEIGCSSVLRHHDGPDGVHRVGSVPLCASQCMWWLGYKVDLRSVRGVLRLPHCGCIHRVAEATLVMRSADPMSWGALMWFVRVPRYSEIITL